MQSGVSAVLKADSSAKTKLQEKRLFDSCQEFSSMMVSYMMKTMRQAYSGGDDPSFASGVYQDMFYDKVAKVVSGSGNLGVDDMLYAQLDRMMKKDPSQHGAAGEAQKSLSSQLSLNKIDNSAE